MSEAGTAQRIPQILELIGKTPMVEIRRLRGTTPERVRLFAKLEGYNPAGSIKDRPAWNMIRRGLDSGELRPGKTIIDSTSGNTGRSRENRTSPFEASPSASNGSLASSCASLLRSS